VNDSAKQSVYEFWNRASCGEELYLADISRESYEAHARLRYTLEPEIVEFAGFDSVRGQAVLEIGVGLGADHARFAANGAELWGVDLTDRAVEHTRRRLQTFGLTSRLSVADAEHLPFAEASFDVVYSWGVLHHSPDTARCIAEVARVLRPGGTARIMIYHTYSMVGYMLWLRYALLRGRPFTRLRTIYARHLESPGTKAYSVAEARALFASFRTVTITTHQGHGDLLTSQAGQRHQGKLLAVARAVWPRWLIRRVLPTHGLTMMITATK